MEIYRTLRYAGRFGNLSTRCIVEALLAIRYAPASRFSLVRNSIIAGLFVLPRRGIDSLPITPNDWKVIILNWTLNSHNLRSFRLRAGSERWRLLGYT